MSLADWVTVTTNAATLEATISAEFDVNCNQYTVAYVVANCLQGNIQLRAQATGQVIKALEAVRYGTAACRVALSEFDGNVLTFGSAVIAVNKAMSQEAEGASNEGVTESLDAMGRAQVPLGQEIYGELGVCQPANAPTFASVLATAVANR